MKGRIYVRKGKNYKERFVPINKHNLELLEEYVFEHRMEFITNYQTDALLLSSHGKRMNDLTIAHRLKAIVDATENEAIIEKGITMHTLRHSIATHLMQNKVPIQLISSFLGHASLESTQIYTHLADPYAINRKYMTDITFTEYLKREGYSKTTIKSYDDTKSKFIDWCNRKNYHSDTMDYKHCLEYVKKLQEIRGGKRVSQSTVKHKVGALKIYFNYLVDQELRFDNPIESVNIRGVKRSLNHNLLEHAELEDLYYSYPTHNIEFPNSPSVAIRNKVITGFIVYQGMNSTALKSLKVDHVHVEKGVVYIPGTRKTNGRTLELKSWQILPLVQYLEKHREIIQEELQNYSQALFPLNSDRFDIISRQLYKKLKRINHKVVSPKKVRASVITYWLSQYNIREVQYMAGHRYISSTERYVQDDLENLQEVIESLHPIS